MEVIWKNAYRTQTFMNVLQIKICRGNTKVKIKTRVGNHIQHLKLKTTS